MFEARSDISLLPGEFTFDFDKLREGSIHKIGTLTDTDGNEYELRVDLSFTATHSDLEGYHKHGTYTDEEGRHIWTSNGWRSLNSIDADAIVTVYGVPDIGDLTFTGPVLIYPMAYERHEVILPLR